MFTLFVSLVVSVLALVIGYSLSSFKSAGFYSKKQKSLIDEVKTLKEQLDAQALLKDDDEVKKVKVFGKNDWPEELICASGSYDSWVGGIAHELDETVRVLGSMGFTNMVPIVKKGLAGDYKKDFLANSVFLPQPRKQAYLIWILMEQSISHPKEKRAFLSFENLYHFLLACYSVNGFLSQKEKDYAETALQHISGSIISDNVTSVSVLPEVWFVNKKCESQLTSLLMDLKRLTGASFEVQVVVESIMRGFAYDLLSLIKEIMLSSNPQTFNVLFSIIIVLFTSMVKKEKEQPVLTETEKKANEAIAKRAKENNSRFTTPPSGIVVNPEPDKKVDSNESREANLQFVALTNLNNKIPTDESLSLVGNHDNMKTGDVILKESDLFKSGDGEDVSADELPVLSLVPEYPELDNRTSEIGNSKTELIGKNLFDSDDEEENDSLDKAKNAVVEEKKEELNESVEIVPFVYTKKAKR